MADAPAAESPGDAGSHEAEHGRERRKKTVTISDRNSTREYDPSKNMDMAAAGLQQLQQQHQQPPKPKGVVYTPSRGSEVWDNKTGYDSDEEARRASSRVMQPFDVSGPGGNSRRGDSDRCSDRCTEMCAVQ
mmetsp:Transcript_29805/g.67526  ORF Transcript_29805/g.67526 Transcript_29805/m.67526 type:complete len:132 (-) Transcript_29805:110-505(-)